MKGNGGLLEDLVPEGETRDQRLNITPFPQPGSYVTWEHTARRSRALRGC